MSNSLIDLKPVTLPFGKTVYQSNSGQGISTESGELVKKILDLECKEQLRVLELGSGSGIISLMIKHYKVDWDIIGIEIQKHLVEISRRNSILAEETIVFQEEDLRRFTDVKGFDLIITNPPYFKVSESRISPNRERAISRHELFCELKDILEAFNRNLNDRGRAYFLYPEYREDELKKSAAGLNMKLDRICEISSLKTTRVRIYRIMLNDRI
ncbi:MAG: methyltransferase [Candidatus Cloacimonetes bacterium]|nr:methyltransferase [Candidatus Cloacimonadota bacterium]